MGTSGDVADDGAPQFPSPLYISGLLQLFLCPEVVGRVGEGCGILNLCFGPFSSSPSR